MDFDATPAGRRPQLVAPVPTALWGEPTDGGGVLEKRSYLLLLGFLDRHGAMAGWGGRSAVSTGATEREKPRPLRLRVLAIRRLENQFAALVAELVIADLSHALLVGGAHCLLHLLDGQLVVARPRLLAA